MPSSPAVRPTYGQLLRNHRLNRCLTVEEVAQRTDLSKGFISQVENERTKPSIATMKLLVDVCIMEREDLDEYGKLQAVWELVSALFELDVLDRRFLATLRLVQSGVHIHTGPCRCSSRATK